ncbi:mug158 [Symbiodinium sp. CCMP2592]|nr:mug158 [Symbiodinium sp. CCMP2592]CAE7727672.1 mug158 [Symbiodinium sp. CCMP2592]
MLPNEDDLGTVLHTAVSAALGKKATEEEVLESMERSLEWRAGDTAAEDYMALCQSGALDEMVGTDRDDEIDEDAAEQQERVHARVKVAKSITSKVRKIRKKTHGKASESTSGRRKPISFESSESWTAERVTKYLPHPKFGYRAMKDYFNKCFRVIASRQRWSASKSWGATGRDSVAVKILLERTWERHCSLHPEETCSWSFGDVCVE